jgi:hypothetical protein
MAEDDPAFGAEQPGPARRVPGLIRKANFIGKSAGRCITIGLEASVGVAPGTHEQIVPVTAKLGGRVADHISPDPTFGAARQSERRSPPAD